jgi:serine/threonine-protein kinase
MFSLVQTLRRLAGSWPPPHGEREQAEAIDSPESSQNDRAAQIIPEAWGILQIRERLSSGTFGAVFRAWDPALDREVALKLFHDAPSKSAIVEEGRILARLRHEHIAAVYGAGVYDGRAGLWMELVRGQSLAEVVATLGPMSPREAALVGIDVCQALSAVHARGLLHRDVKAENVMREPGGRIVLIDFGLGEFHQPAEYASREIAGTPLYMAPELFEGGRSSPATEIYAVGVLLFYLASGRFPVEAQKLEDIRKSRRGQALLSLAELRPDIPRPFRQAVERALAENPRDRFRSVAALADELHSVLASPTPSRRLPSLRTSALAGTVVATVLAGGVGLRWWLDHPSTGSAPVVWVTDTVAPQGQPDFAGLTVALREQIRLSDSVIAFDATQVPAILERMTLSPKTPLTGHLRREVAQRMGVSYILDSAVVPVGTELRLKVAVESIGRSSLISAGRAEREFSFDDPSHAPAAVREAARWVREIAREPIADIDTSDGDPAEVTTANLAALSHYFRGEKLYLANQRQEAVAEWKAALALDPDFLQAHIQLAGTLGSLHHDLEGLQEYANACSLLGKRRLGGRESYRVRSAFLVDSGDIADGDAIQAEWAARFPNDDEALEKRAYPLLTSGHPQEALNLLERAWQINPHRRATAHYLAISRLVLGDLSHLHQETGRLRDTGDPNLADLFESTGEFLRGNHLAAWRLNRAVFNRTRGNPGSSGSRVSSVLHAADLWAEMGRPDLSIRLLESDLTPAESMGSNGDIAREWCVLARLHLMTGNLERAADAAREALRLESGPRILSIALPILVRCGQTDEAFDFLREFERNIPSAEARMWYSVRLPRLLTEGEAFFQQKKYREALARFQQADKIDAPHIQRDYLIRLYAALADRPALWRESLRAASVGPYLIAASDKLYPGAWSNALAQIERLCSFQDMPNQDAATCTATRKQLTQFHDSSSIPNSDK